MGLKEGLAQYGKPCLKLFFFTKATKDDSIVGAHVHCTVKDNKTEF